MADFGKFLIIIGAILIVAGLGMIFMPKGFALGSLPGDLKFKVGSANFYFPLTTSIVLSIILSGITYLLKYFK